MKTLYLMCGPAGSGKTTWVKGQMAIAPHNTIHISRDVVRLEYVPEDEPNLFSREDEVFAEFCARINRAILNTKGPQDIYVDATHLTEKARNKTLDSLFLDNIRIIPVAFTMDLNTVLARNELRKGSGRAYVPRSVIRRMYASYRVPTHNEKYAYATIQLIGE